MVATLDRRRLAGTGIANPHAKYFLDLVDTIIAAINLGLGGVLVPVASIAALKAITAAVRSDKVLCLVEDTGLFRFDAESAATGDDEYVVAPTAGTGRWILVMRSALPRGISDPVADLAALKATSAVDLADRTLYFCETLGLYYYDAQDVQANDDVTVIVPTAVTRPAAGSFLLLAPISTSALETKATVASRIIGPLADLAALKAVAEADRGDRTTVLVETLGFYRFDADDATAGDDVEIVEPTAGTGRWIRVAPPAISAYITAALVGARILAPVADLAALKAIAEATRGDRVLIHVEAKGLYRFDADDATAQDDDDIVTPTAGTGRWIRVATLAGGAFYTQVKALANELRSDVAALAAGHTVVNYDADPATNLNATAIKVGVALDLPVLAALQSQTNGNADTYFETTDGSRAFVKDSDTPAGVDLYVTPAGLFKAALPTGKDAFIVFHDGRLMKVGYAADPATGNTQVFVDDDGATVSERLCSAIVATTDVNVALETDRGLGQALPTISAAAVA